MQEKLNYLVNEITCMKHNLKSTEDMTYRNQALQDINASYKQIGKLFLGTELSSRVLGSTLHDVGQSYYEEAIRNA